MRLRSRVLPGSPPGSAPGAPPPAAAGGGAAAVLVTGDPTLHDDVARLAAAAALRIEVVGTAEEALHRWTSAAVVLVGEDLLAPLAERRPPSRPEVHVLTLGAGDAVYRHALGIGAQGVVELPRAEAWLADLLADLADGHVRQARTVAVVAGSGGAGASVLAAALAQVGARDRAVTLVDLDPGGGGADRLLGLDDHDGLRWDRLADTQGRLSSRALRDALPGDEMLRVLTWDHRDAEAGPSDTVVREVVSAARRGSDLVVLDVPRDLERPGVTDALCVADLVVVCARTSVLPVVAAGRVVSAVTGVGVPVGVVARTGIGSVDPLDVAETLGLPLLAEVATRRRVEELLDLGLGPAGSPWSPLTRAARDVLAALRAEVAA